MTAYATAQPHRQPLRLWPGVLAAVLTLLCRFVIPIVDSDAFGFAVVGGLVGALAIVVWWTLFSRAPWSERLGGLALMVVAVLATRPLLHKSIATGMMGMMFVIYAIPPVLTPAFVAWATASPRLSDRFRRASMVATVLLACGVWTLLRTDGIIGGAGAQLAWRWTKTPEERLLAQVGDEPKALPLAPAATEILKEQGGPLAAGASDNNSARREPPALPDAPATAKTEPVARAATEIPAEWPGFRGPRRDGIIRGVRIDTDWSKSPPSQMWRRPIGPGWSSFAVRGDFLYTQEQRGEDEVVASYKVSTGEPVWRHRDAVRFWESNGGAGPRATPTLSRGRLYTFGATGIVNALDVGNGSVVWSRNAASDTGVPIPMWGFASSPLVVDDLVIVAVSGALAAYDLATGTPRWSRKSEGGSYSSPHLVTIDGVPQVLLLGGAGATSVAPADGTVLWQHAWPGEVIVQPAFTADGDVLVNTIGMTGGAGVRRLAVAHELPRPSSGQASGWHVEERWTSTGLKPYFNDFVVHKGHAFGFDGSILSCIGLEDGKRTWKGGRYGNGQLVLLPDADVLLVLSEDGELALVSATPDRFKELARFPALNGKTWNHPVLIGDVLLVRNGEEMAAFRLSLADR
jgi:outer membrane protein assembly factor BamB